ncbi:MAG TPA: hypothetical protein VFD11_08725 [Thiopseudomonas sp.]|nr:hypothetical protein [Thiopseudomonas sp.]
MSELYLRIALPSPLRRLFDYRAPARIATQGWQSGVRMAAHMHGRTITLIMLGNTFGVSLGLLLMTFIGTQMGCWPVFLLLGVLGASIALLAVKYPPSLKGENY